MGTEPMHEDEVTVDEPLVRRLLAAQLPHLAGAEVEAVASVGTVNAVFRLGPELCVRLPRHQRWADDLDKELRWLPVLGPRLPLAIPQPVAVGEPGRGYPLRWAVYRWIEGDTYDPVRVTDESRAAVDLAGFVAQLRRIDVSGAPPSGRLPLHQLDEATRWAIDACGDRIDAAAATHAWDRALEAPTWHGTAVWRHCDLLPPNVLVRDGRLTAVIDFGVVGVGDPAADVIAAWSMFGDRGRRSFRAALGVDDGTWQRARGYALHQALFLIPYYRRTNPAFAATGWRTVTEVLADTT